jgi:hypothetical protein
MAALWDVFDGAMRVLVGTGAIKARLTEAWRDHLSPVLEKDVPEPLRGRLTLLRTAMHAAHAAGGMTGPEVSIRKMSEQEAAQHATRILEMYAVLATIDSDAGVQPRLRIVGSQQQPEFPFGNADDLPAFLSRA